jgi:hypothetical protein
MGAARGHKAGATNGGASEATSTAATENAQGQALGAAGDAATRRMIGDEPRLPTGKDMDGNELGELHYQEYKGDLFVNGIKGTDVGQGDLGDCYFLSSLAALANTHPDLIRNAIKDNGDGTYTVTFKERVKGAVNPVPIRVDAKFPTTASGAQKFGKGLETGPHGQELWPALFEKAYATWQENKGGYAHINQGGEAGDALTGLTGAASETIKPDHVPVDDLWGKLTSAAKAGDPMCASTPLTKELERRTGGKDLKGLMEGHFYTVVDAVDSGGARTVKLYTTLVDFTSDPVSTPSPADNPQRHIEFPVEDFRRYFDELVINRMGGG